MKDYILHGLFLILLGLILLKLDAFEKRFDDINDCVVGSGEAIITEMYRYKGD